MALKKCKECGHDVSTQAAACPGCGAKIPTFAEKAGALVAVSFVAFLIILWWSSSSSPIKNAESTAHKTLQEQPTSQSIATQEEDAKPLSNKEAAEALSKYIGDAQSKILAMSVVNDIYLSKIKQDMAWGNLNKYQEDAEAMKDAAQKGQQELFNLQYPNNLSDEQSAKFEDVASSISDMAMAFVSMDVDVAVNAHTGMDVNSELEKDIREVKTTGRKFKEKSLTAYKFFGYSPNQIDKSTLTIKTADRGSGQDQR